MATSGVSSSWIKEGARCGSKLFWPHGLPLRAPPRSMRPDLNHAPIAQSSLPQYYPKPASPPAHAHSSQPSCSSPSKVDRARVSPPCCRLQTHRTSTRERETKKEIGEGKNKKGIQKELAHWHVATYLVYVGDNVIRDLLNQPLPIIRKQVLG